MTDNNQVRSIIQKLEKVATEIRLQTLTKEALKLITILMAGVMTFFVLDVLAHFPYVLRLLIFFGGAGFCIHKFVKGPLADYKRNDSSGSFTCRRGPLPGIPQPSYLYSAVR